MSAGKRGSAEVASSWTPARSNARTASEWALLAALVAMSRLFLALALVLVGVAVSQ